MTSGERLVWAAVYAASWHQSMGGPPGVVDDIRRARWCADQASRALGALRGFAAEQAAEVLDG